MPKGDVEDRAVVVDARGSSGLGALSGPGGLSASAAITGPITARRRRERRVSTRTVAALVIKVAVDG
jgi:hypothetical protein